ncbi:MAG: hypothetical protein ACNA8R_01860 [Nitriliruptoraceae bacterium]
MGARSQTLLDRMAVLPGVLAGERIRFFRDGTDGPTWREQLAIATPVLPPLHLGTPLDVEVATLAGPLRVGVLLAHDAGPGAPVLVTHHGNNEQPFALEGRRAKNFLNRALLSDDTPPPATVVLLRAAYHDGPLKEYTRAAGDLARWMAILAASVAGARAVIDHYSGDHGRTTVLTGFSLGGWVTNLHRAYDGGADRYVPMLAGAHLASQLLDSSYRHMTSRRAHVDADRVRERLDFADDFRAADAPVAPLLARYDRFARAEDQRDDYTGWPITWLETGHVGAALAGDQLRAHVLRQLPAAAGAEVGS